MMYIIHLRYLGARDLVQFMLALKIRGPESEPKNPCENTSIKLHAYQPCDWETRTGKFLEI